MKKSFTISKVCMLFIAVIFSFNYADAQLSGTYTIGGTSPDYSTLSAAVSDLNSSGVNGAVIFNIRDGNYSGSSWRASIGNVTGASATNTITFQSQSGNKANCVISPSGSSSANYVFYFNSSKYITVKNLTLNNTNSSYGCDVRFNGSANNITVENCVLTGNTSNSTSTNKARVYANSFASGSKITFKDNDIIRGSYGVYFRGNNTSSTSNDHIFEGNTFDQNYRYGFYGYYLGELTLKDNVVKRTGSGTYYGFYTAYTRDNQIVTGNTYDINTTSTTYVTQFRYTNRYSNNKDKGIVMTNNTYNVESRTNSVYVMYNYYNYYGYYADNIVNTSSSYTSGYIYNYSMYYDRYSVMENNTFNYDKAGGYIYHYNFLWVNTKDTFRHNTVNMEGNSYKYNYIYYSQDFACHDNEYNLESSSRTMYGAYLYRYGQNGHFYNNKINCETNTGTVYGMYPYYVQGTKIYGNSVVTKTQSSNYTLRVYRSYTGTEIFNNTFHSNSTGFTNYSGYIYCTSSSYGAELKNNIFSRSSNKGYLYYVYNSNYVKGDYNLFHAPSGNVFYRATPYFTTNSLTTWRNKTKDDMNSLVHDPGYNDAANGDVTIDPTSPNAWAVNGRAEHDTTAVTDLAGVVRPKFVTDGVPDLGAYEVSPTSTPPLADASPSAPVANSTQVFTFGEDTVATIDWGSTVPASYDVRQYTGVQAGPMPTGVGRMYFYAAGTASDYEHSHTPHVYYKDPWIGDVPSEQEAVIARSTNGGAWEGYNYSNASTDAKRNILSPAFALDSVGSYTGVQEGRIGIRCVEAPKGVIISNILKDGADITWDPVFNPIGYQIIVNTSSAMPSDVDWNNPANFVGTNTKTFTNLAEDTKFYVHIRSICGAKDTSGRTVDSFVTLIDCHVPDIKISGLSDTRAIAYWGDIKTSYKYEYVINTSASTPAFGTDITQTSVQAPFLDADKQYYVHVKAHCSSIYPESGWGVAAFKTFPLGVSNVTTEGNGVEVYPNPAGEQLNVVIGGKLGADGKVMVTDVTGKVLQVSEVTGNTISVNVSGLASGVYMLQYTDDVRRETVKFNKK